MAFAVAEQLDRTVELDSLCRAAVLNRVGALPENTLLFINVAPQVLGHESIAGDRLQREVLAAGLEPAQVVLEITERGAIDRQLVATEIGRLRDLGFKVAIDDIGTGAAQGYHLGRPGPTPQSSGSVGFEEIAVVS
ncbi:MAG TPA: EAL domain-containing protein [Acidimicrobiales bacterium]